MGNMPKRSDTVSEGSVGTTLASTHRVMRMMNNTLVMAECYFDFNLDVIPNGPKGKQAEVITRMKYWLDNMLENCIIVPMNRTGGVEWMQELDNLMMFAPSDPNDFLIQVMVHAKLQAIGAGLVNIASSHMTSDISNGFGIWFQGDPDELLPLQKDWMGERVYFELPWWHRGDAGMIDVPVGPEDDVRNKPDIIVDWHLLMEMPTVPDTEAKTAEIIRPSFKPRIVSDD